MEEVGDMVEEEDVDHGEEAGEAAVDQELDNNPVQHQLMEHKPTERKPTVQLHRKYLRTVIKFRKLFWWSWKSNFLNTTSFK